MNSSNNSLPFVQGVKITLSSIQAYPEFAGKFIEPVDITLCKLISEDKNLAKEVSTLFNSTVMTNIRPNGHIPVVHNQRHKLGRFYADNDISLIPHSRLVKHTLMKHGGWCDIDMVKGHPSIAVELFKGIISLQAIQHYINNFES